MDETEPSNSQAGDTTHESCDPIELVLALQRAAAGEEQEGPQCSEQGWLTTYTYVNSTTVRAGWKSQKSWVCNGNFRRIICWHIWSRKVISLITFINSISILCVTLHVLSPFCSNIIQLLSIITFLLYRLAQSTSTSTTWWWYQYSPPPPPHSHGIKDKE